MTLTITDLIFVFGLCLLACAVCAVLTGRAGGDSDD